MSTNTLNLLFQIIPKTTFCQCLQTSTWNIGITQIFQILLNFCNNFLSNIIGLETRIVLYLEIFVKTEPFPNHYYGLLVFFLSWSRSETVNLPEFNSGTVFLFLLFFFLVLLFVFESQDSWRLRQLWTQLKWLRTGDIFGLSLATAPCTLAMILATLESAEKVIMPTLGVTSHENLT